MATRSAQPSLRDVGYRRGILAAGALWGAAPAVAFAVDVFGGATPEQAALAFGALATVTLGVLFELDSRALEARGTGVPLAWSYALVAPISVVAWGLLAPGLLALPGGWLAGVLAGPPAAALLYVWQRGRVADAS
ncbi:MAG: hypothetical protein ABEJ88_02260 [Halobacterium sp.]